MRRIHLCVAAAILSMALATTAQAGPKGGGGHGPGSHGPSKSGGSKSGTSKSGTSHNGTGKGSASKSGIKGKSGHHWGKKTFDKRYGCKLYFDAGTGDWYYWCSPDDCYYPVDYCPYGTYSWDDEGDD